MVWKLTDMAVFKEMINVKTVIIWWSVLLLLRSSDNLFRQPPCFFDNFFETPLYFYEDPQRNTRASPPYAVLCLHGFFSPPTIEDEIWHILVLAKHKRKKIHEQVNNRVPHVV